MRTDELVFAAVANVGLFTMLDLQREFRYYVRGLEKKFYVELRILNLDKTNIYKQIKEIQSVVAYQQGI